MTLIQNEQQGKNANQPWLIDSFPVALAKQGHRFKACVAKEIADSGYCATKRLYFYGVRDHELISFCKHISHLDIRYEQGPVFVELSSHSPYYRQITSIVVVLPFFSKMSCSALIRVAAWE